MRLLHLVLTIAVSLAAISNGTAATAAKSITDSDPSNQVVTRGLSGKEEALEEERKGGRGGGGGGRGGGRGTTTRGQIHGTHTSIGLMYPNHLSHRKTKCDEVKNWWQSLFDKSVKKCPKKDGEDEEEGNAKRLRA
ncbi:hypothetical protein PF005_g20942 [Phytophthora fragariae]|uniref:RxLR effector protein n=1 Tax=Phytophthora fragariae TaxID=53985 RepID=A0A6A3QYG0_9STRA|nr:hypothetical protein PF009_g21924 [Phytophthora fragariae]KAE8984704.1 hypothetical protein PF011_g20674 [Phytophthora fragariae]KAE9083347.1 hypothetical protein PF010_g21244 [Phytophthora fragariae]KAE9085845.1 hypothetical protein PF007_g20992 [Phytophthora fragariae]KAE9108003.1 hypothetical protein PF006_g20970 [Phytophthora fragariae]